MEKLLNELANRAVEPVPPGLAEDIKQQIPQGLSPHKRGMNTINIIIDLRVNRFTAAAAIIVAIILFVTFFGSRDSTDGSLYQDGILLAKYLLGSKQLQADGPSAGLKLYQSLIQQGINVTYYGDTIDLKDKDAVLMYWKPADGDYKVYFSDLRVETVTAEELIKLQTRMLQKNKE